METWKKTTDNFLLNQPRRWLQDRDDEHSRAGSGYLELPLVQAEGVHTLLVNIRKGQVPRQTQKKNIKTVPLIRTDHSSREKHKQEGPNQKIPHPSRHTWTPFF